MRRIVGAAFTSLDGVMQAPGGPSEDPTGGFQKGGWIAPLWDEQVDAVIGKLFGQPFDLLLGRRTYDIFASYWPYVGDDQKDIRDPFNAATKYVVTHDEQPLAWENSVRVAAIGDLAAVKQGDGPDLVIQGSTTLYPQLLDAGLLDEVTLMMFPLVLGTGKRWFGDGTPPTTLRPTQQSITSRGTVIATYEPAGAVETMAIAPPSTSDRESVRQAAMAEGSW